MGIAEQIEWFNSAGLKIPLDHQIVLRCIEVRERRNCIVHARGEASSFYLNNCKSRGIDFASLKEGDKLKLDANYCNGAFESILVLGVIFFSASWIKLCKKEDKDWDLLTGIINSIVYDLMVDGIYVTAETLINFIPIDLKITLSDLDRRLFKTNLALCRKELGDKAGASKILDSEDWRASDLRFQSAVSAIRGDTDETLKLLKAGYGAGQIDKQALTEWPVFNHVRQLKKFKKLYSDLLGPEEAEGALTEPIEARSIGPGLQKIVGDVLKHARTFDKEARKSDAKKLTSDKDESVDENKR